MNDPILASFLEQQYSEASRLSDNSDLVNLIPGGPKPYQSYLLLFRCKGLVYTGDGVVESDHSEIGVQFPDDYLRRAEPGEVLTWLGPSNAFHPAIRYPFICPGHLYPGESLVEIIYQCFEIITYRKVNMNEFKALNRQASAWARANQARFPIDSRPLGRQRLNLRVEGLDPSDALAREFDASPSRVQDNAEDNIGATETSTVEGSNDAKSPNVEQNPMKGVEQR